MQPALSLPQRRATAGGALQLLGQLITTPRAVTLVLLAIERLELVHLHCPQCADDQEVTALITFRASVYFVYDRTGAYTRGPRSPSRFQELWVFRRRGEGWLLQDIERTHESDRHERPNLVADLTDQQLANAQCNIAL